LQRLQHLADRAAVIIGGAGVGGDGRGVEIDAAAACVGIGGAARKILGVVDLWQTKRIGPARLGVAAKIIGREVERLFDGGHSRVRPIRLPIGGDHRIYARAKSTDAFFDLSSLGFLRWLLLCRHFKPPHVNIRINRRTRRLRPIAGVAARKPAF